MSEAAQRKASPWVPVSDPRLQKALGKMNEELGEATAAASRVLIQGLGACDPVTFKPNRQWLLEEIADVYASTGVALEEIDFTQSEAKELAERVRRKQALLKEWLEMLPGGPRKSGVQIGIQPKNDADPWSAKGILDQARELVAGDRAKTHGDKLINHANIALLWSSYLQVPVSPDQVAIMMVLLKVARTQHGGLNRDDYVDMAGYAGVAGDIVGRLNGQHRRSPVGTTDGTSGGTFGGVAAGTMMNNAQAASAGDAPNKTD